MTKNPRARLPRGRGEPGTPAVVPPLPPAPQGLLSPLRAGFAAIWPRFPLV